MKAIIAAALLAGIPLAAWAQTDQELKSAATRTDGVNHSLMNKQPSSDHSPARGHPR